MTRIKTIIILFLAVLASGCATGLNSVQNMEYRNMEANKVLIQEKNPTTGAVLGLLPGGGSFYAGEPGYGIVNLLFWPLSILWDPISGYQGSKAINYAITKQDMHKKMAAEISTLDDKLASGVIKAPDYVVEKHNIEKKYALE